MKLFKVIILFSVLLGVSVGAGAVSIAARGIETIPTDQQCQSVCKERHLALGKEHFCNGGSCYCTCKKRQ